MQPSERPPDRAVFFVDGNNWYHGLKHAGVADQKRISLAKIAKKLAGPRTWTEIRYYIGQVPQTGNPRLYAEQRSYLAQQRNLDARFSWHFGRLEQRHEKNQAADDLLAYLAGLSARKIQIDRQVFKELVSLGTKHKNVTFRVEKAVDVMLAVDLVVLGERDGYDAAYVLSADGDYTHAATFVRGLNKKVFAVSASSGAQLAAAANAFIKIDRAWLADCYI
jgi:uncharacterized LabA/DUF88 family protein